MEAEELDKDEKYLEFNKSSELSSDFKRWIQSKEYKQFFKESKGLTNAQKRFAEYLFTIKEHITPIGDMVKVFASIRQFCKHNQSK